MSKLITDPATIWLAIVPVDMRHGIDGLSMIAQQALGKAPSSGAAIVFRNRLGNRIKVLLWDGTGCGCVSVAYMKVISFGQSPQTLVFRSPLSNGSGYCSGKLAAIIGHSVRRLTGVKDNF